jgi:hypothetical protein
LALNKNHSLAPKELYIDFSVLLFLQACLYGLGTTLRCAGGGKYSSVSSLGVSSELQELLSQLVHPETQQRPNLEETLEVS